MSIYEHHPLADRSRTFHHPVQALEAEARFLREVEREGERGETPLIAMLSVAGVLAPILALMMVLAFLAAHLFG